VNIGDIAKAIGAEYISFQQNDTGFLQVSIDSRDIVPGGFFIALAGMVTDGHRYVEDAFRAGAVAAMIDRLHYTDPTFQLAKIAQQYYTALVVVENTIYGLQDAAAWYIMQFPDLLRIGITGSSGKTTTKEIAAAMIAGEKSVVMNRGNLNSEIGLPLSIFAVRDHHKVGIFEMGMNRHGEIAELTRVLRPHIALITNIGSAHIGIIGSNKQIALEKKMIFSQFSGNEIALIPAYDIYRDVLAEGIKGRIIFYDSPFKEVCDQGLKGYELVYEGIPVQFALPGQHNLKNAAAAVAITCAILVGEAAIRQGLAQVSPLFGRTEIMQGPVTVIRDCYNANPESTQAAIVWCDDLAWTGQKIYVIGSMLELGIESEKAHKQVGCRLASSKADIVCFLGTETEPAVKIVQQEGKIPCFYTDSISDLAQFLIKNIHHGDLVLLKGSRGCALEQLMEVFGCF
jgi:UDP-N-acetylmuramoyl-tripeptide--D-alanyl-D-alanine ligase